MDDDALTGQVELGIHDRALDEACTRLSAMLLDTGADGFAGAARGGFTNSPAEIRRWLERCAGLLTESEGEYTALYAEMNGFTINPDHRWVGVEAWLVPIVDFETLEDGQADIPLHHRENLTLRGWAAMQGSFERYVGGDERPSAEFEAATRIARCWST